MDGRAEAGDMTEGAGETAATKAGDGLVWAAKVAAVDSRLEPGIGGGYDCD